MKNWESPSIECLEVKFTEHGRAVSTNIDEIRVDQNGNRWCSYSGEEKGVNPDGDAITDDGNGIEIL